MKPQGPSPALPTTPKGRPRIPEHVIFKTLPRETIVLDLGSGRYYSLNPTAGRMLEVLSETSSLEAARAELVDEFGHPSERIGKDFESLCDLLESRGLLAYSPG